MIKSDNTEFTLQAHGNINQRHIKACDDLILFSKIAFEYIWISLAKLFYLYVNILWTQNVSDALLVL